MRITALISRPARSVHWVLATLGLLCLSQTACATSQGEAEAHIANQEWQQAASAFSELLKVNADNADNWFQLAVARERLENFKGAGEAYQRSLDQDFQPAARARYSLARMMMHAGRAEDALVQLELVAESGGPGFRTVQNAVEFEPLRGNQRFIAVVEALKPCAPGEYHQFDFWHGSWDVTPAGATQPTASNEISSIQDGCVTLEQYVAGGFTGMSLNFYDAALGRWHQTWMSNAGGALYLEGALRKDGAMEMTDRNLPISKQTGNINKVVWTPRPNGSVHQFWQSSSDGGATWSSVFDGIYTRKAAQ